jgi:cell division protein FtsI/penicillin-binding protein 2
MTRRLWLAGCGLCLAQAAFPQASYLLLDARSGAVIRENWPDAARPVPLGSLVKPFTALAYAETHGFRYPEYECRGENCWLARGHGRLGIREAIAYSCNAYFLKLAAATRNAGDLAARFGIPGPGPDAPPAERVGLGDGWRATPVAIARAYAELAARRGAPGVDELLAGMALSATIGTGNAIHASALVKTGTAPCVHSPRMPGDGYVIALCPAEAPRIALLVQLHGAPGSQAARAAAELLEACKYNR